MLCIMNHVVPYECTEVCEDALLSQAGGIINLRARAVDLETNFPSNPFVFMDVGPASLSMIEKVNKCSR